MKQKKLNPLLKHPLKDDVCTDVSAKGATSIFIFTVTLIATRLISIFESGLLPFVREVFLDDHINDPKHARIRCFWKTRGSFCVKHFQKVPI